MYTTERNIQILVALLKSYGIKKIVASPGSMDYSFISSVQDDRFFDVISCFDERSAAYMACGIASETNEAVAICCTGATSSRNYMPGLTEAFYRKLPIVAITCLSSRDNIGQLIGQQIDRSQQPKDLVVESVYVPLVNDPQGEVVCEREINKALLALSKNGGGPVHIDLCSCMDSKRVAELPSARRIQRYELGDRFPSIPVGRVAIMVGAHKKMNEDLVCAIDKFCEAHNAIVYCVNPRSYYGKYAANVSLLFSQFHFTGELNAPDLCIQIGEITTDSVGFSIYPKDVWRVGEDGVVRDRYNVLSNIFYMKDIEFFRAYSEGMMIRTTQYQEWKALDDELRAKMPEICFSNAWIAQYMAPKMPVDVELFLGIANSIRAWDYANPSPKLHTNSNTGGFGIDGCVSAMIGASIVAPCKQFYGIFGDLSFFYDLNVIGNRHVGNNVHIMLINNDGGQQFRNADHPIYHMRKDVDRYVAAAGHNGAKCPLLLHQYVESLGYVYISASNKNEFIEKLPQFMNGEKPVLFEVFTEASDEDVQFMELRNIIQAPREKGLIRQVKSAIKHVVGIEGINVIKSITKK